jgi:PAS domain S-box-containing protein
MARILIIEDHSTSRDLLVTLLSYQGHTLFEAREGAEGLALTLAEQPDLVITDILMPEMDGYEFARRVRTHPDLAQTRVMFYTATYLAEEVRKLAAACGVAHILIKPAEPQKLLDTVNAALNDPPPAVTLAPPAEMDREYLRLLTNTLHHKVEELKAEVRARTRAEAESRHQVDRARVQAEISRALAEVSRDYQATLDTTADQLAEVIGDACVVRLVSDDGAWLELAALSHPDPEAALFARDILAGAKYRRADEGLSGRAIQTGEPVLIQATSSEQLKAMLGPKYARILDRLTIASLLIAPLRAAGRAIGVLMLMRTQPGRPYTADDQTLLQDLADRAALAILNARLHADLQRSNAALEQRVAERMAELRQRATMIDLASDAIIIRGYTIDTITYWNQGAERLYGWAAGDTIGRSIHQLLKTEFPAPLDDIRAAFVHAGHWEGELTHTCRDGRRVTVFSRWTLQLEESGRPASFLEINTDITERKRAELALQHAHDDLAQANAGLQATIAERVQLEGQIRQSEARARALAELSQALAEARLEYQPVFDTIVRRISELLGDTCVLTLISADGQWLETRAIHHPDPEGVAFMWEMLAGNPLSIGQGMAGRVVQTGQALLVPLVPVEQIRAQLKPEHEPYLDRFGMARLLIVPLRSRDRVLGAIGVSQDRPGRPYTSDEQIFLQELADRAGLAIENTRLFVELREAHREAERANLAKSAFLSSMSHELRTPLNAIIGFTGTLLMKLPGPLTADQEKQLKIVRSSARHLLSLINDLLDLAKIESGKIELSREPVVCQDVIGEVAASMRPQAEQKGLAFTVAQPAEPIIVQSDRRTLNQIVLNLANNAIKFTEQGELRIELAREPSTSERGAPTIDIERSQERGGEMRSSRDERQATAIVFRVSDTGIGIKSEDQARLFQAFEQAESGSGRREGTGLGLHLSQKLAQLLGGRITFESEYGVGSTFTLIFEE